MKAIRTKPAKAVNPLFSHAERRAARIAGKEYETSQFIELQVGEEVEDPHAWRLCVIGMAAPADDECRQRVLKYLGDPGRQQLIQDLKLLRQHAKTTKLSKKDARYLEIMEKAYAVDLGLAPSPVRGGVVILDGPPDETDETNESNDQ